jgi:deoxyadenosine/deoxycytidine kinase
MASGKSTLVDLLAAHFDHACAIPETFEDNPFLPLFLQDNARWGFACQLRYFYDYIRVFDERSAGGGYRYHFIDAGAWTNRLIHGAYMRGEGVITPEEHAFYDEMCAVIERAYPQPDPFAFIYLRLAPEICLQRLQGRGWAFQAPVSLDYLQTLHGYFERMAQTVPAPVLTLDSAALDFRVEADQQTVLRRIEGFFRSHERGDS